MNFKHYHGARIIVDLGNRGEGVEVENPVEQFLTD